MNWYYAVGGQQQGPISETELEALFKAGTIDGATLVWREGMAAWQPYAQAKGIAVSAPAVAAGTGGMVCSQCGQAFPPDQVLRLGDAWVCAGCKPLYVQRLREGGGTSGRAGRRPLPVNADALIEEIRQRDYEVEIGQCISRGWELVKNNAGLAIGTTLLATICQGGGYIPVIGPIISLIISGPMMGGIYYFFLKLARGESVTVGDAFSGFSKAFGRLLGAYFAMALAVLACLVPGGVLLFALNNQPAIGGVLLGLGLIPAMYLGVGFTFLFTLIMDMDLSIADALKVSVKVVHLHWGKIFLLIICASLLAAVGLVACIIGIVVTLPIFYATIIFAYEDIFGLKESQV